MKSEEDEDEVFNLYSRKTTIIGSRLIVAFRKASAGSFGAKLTGTAL